MMIQEEIIETTKIQFFDDYIDNNSDYVLKNLEMQIQKFLSEYMENN